MSTPKQDAKGKPVSDLKALYARDVRDLIPSPEYYEAEAWFCGYESVSAAKSAAEEAADVWNWRRPVD